MRTWAVPVSAGVCSAVFVGVLRTLDSRGADLTVLSDLAQLVAAVLASAGCAVAVRRSTGRRRRAWQCLAAGTGCWAAGQAVWTFYEVLLDRAVPFPSLADVGYLAFPLVAGAGLVLWPGRGSHDAVTRGRDVLDGGIIAISLLVLSWVTVMSPLVETNDGSGFSLVLSLAYPVGDVVLASLVLLLLFRSESDRLPLVLLSLGLGGFAVADSLFSYLTSAGTYSSADLVSSSGWVAGFLFVAAAGTSVSTGPLAEAEHRELQASSSWLWLGLPYLPLAAAGVALFVDLLAKDSAVLTDLILGVGLVLLVLVRQFLAMIDNQRLMTALGDAGARLEFIATHDALTGLPNRTLFAARLDQALVASASVSVLFCDLDDFKPVNDEHGHAVGDRLLQVVADRLRGCTRVTDTVARLGGDEFAIVLVDSPDPRAVADRVVSCVGQETSILGRRLSPTISVGLAEEHMAAVGDAGRSEDPASVERRTPALAIGGLESDVLLVDDAAANRELVASQLLRIADAAMYAAKAAGKGRAAAIEFGPVGTIAGPGLV